MRKKDKKVALSKKSAEEEHLVARSLNKSWSTEDSFEVTVLKLRFFGRFKADFGGFAETWLG